MFNHLQQSFHRVAQRIELGALQLSEIFLRLFLSSMIENLCVTCLHFLKNIMVNKFIFTFGKFSSYTKFHVKY